MQLKLVVIILIFSITSYSYSQEIRSYDLEKQAEHARLKKYDSTYRVNYFENIMLKLYSTTNINRFSIQSLDGASQYELEPIGEYFFGLSFDYKWLALAVSFTPEFMVRANDEGFSNDASSVSISLNFYYSDRWRQEFRYTNVQSFRNNSTNELSALLDFSNTELNLIMGRTFFVVNPNFSYRAYYAQTERQLKSAGSWVPRLVYSYAHLQPNLPLTGTQLDSIHRIESFDIVAQVGYMYTFVTNQKWYATLGLHAGLGYNFTDYTTVNSNDFKLDSGFFALESDFALGYNAYRWFFGINGNWRNFNNNNNDANSTVSDFIFLGIHFGYRFNDNKPMRKFFGWFEDHLGF